MVALIYFSVQNKYVNKYISNSEKINTNKGIHLNNNLRNKITKGRFICKES